MTMVLSAEIIGNKPELGIFINTPISEVMVKAMVKIPVISVVFIIVRMMYSPLVIKIDAIVEINAGVA
jgi:hypothetical protein